MSQEAELREWISKDFNASFGHRIRRLEHVIKEFGQEEGICLFHGGDLSKALFEEARWCFVNGQFIGCLLLCQCFLEQSLSSLLGAAGPSCGVEDKGLEQAGFYDLVEKAREVHLISDSEANNLHWIRKARVQYVHPKPPWSRKFHAWRCLKEGRASAQVIESDAKRAITVVLRLTQGPLFRAREPSK